MEVAVHHAVILRGQKSPKMHASPSSHSTCSDISVFYDAQPIEQKRERHEAS